MAKSKLARRDAEALCAELSAIWERLWDLEQRPDAWPREIGTAIEKIRVACEAAIYRSRNRWRDAESMLKRIAEIEAIEASAGVLGKSLRDEEARLNADLARLANGESLPQRRPRKRKAKAIAKSKTRRVQKPQKRRRA